MTILKFILDYLFVWFALGILAIIIYLVFDIIISLIRQYRKK